MFIGSPNEEMAQKAISIIEGLTKDVEVGETYTGTVARLTNFGAFVEILPGKDGLVRTGGPRRLPGRAGRKMSCKVGDEVMVMVIEVDSMGRVNLSRRAVLEGLSAEEALAASQRDQANRPQRSGGPPRRDFGRDRGPRRRWRWRQRPSARRRRWWRLRRWPAAGGGGGG